MAWNKPVQQSPLLTASTKCKTELVTPALGSRLTCLEGTVYNRSGGTANVGVAVKHFNDAWKAGQWDDSATPRFIDDTADAQDSGTNDFALFTTTDNDGFAVQASRQFNIVGIDVTTVETGSPVIVFQYWNGTAWTALTTIETPDFTITASDQYLVFQTPPDWVKGGDTNDGIDSDKYAVRVIATTAPATAALAAELWLCRFLSFQSSISTDKFHQFALDSQVVHLESGESLLGFFGTANANNMAQFLFQELK